MSNLLRLYHVPENYFSITKTDISDPSFLIRKKFRDYVEVRMEKSAEFGEMIKQRRIVLPDCFNSWSSGNCNQCVTDFKKAEYEYLMLEKLSLDLRSVQFKRKYLLFGPTGAECDICNNDWLSVAYIIPTILFDYLLEILLVKLILDSSSRKQRWNIFAYSVVVSAFVLESLDILNFDSSNGILTDIMPRFSLKLEQIFCARSIVFSSLVAFIWTFDLDPPSEGINARITEIAALVSELSTKMTSLLITKQALFSDAGHKLKYIEFLNKSGVEITNSRLMQNLSSKF